MRITVSISCRMRQTPKATRSPEFVFAPGERERNFIASHDFADKGDVSVRHHR